MTRTWGDRCMQMKPAHWNRRTRLFRPDEYVCSACGASCGEPYGTCPSCGTPMKKTKTDPFWADEAEGLSALLDEDW